MKQRNHKPPKTRQVKFSDSAKSLSVLHETVAGVFGPHTVHALKCEIDVVSDCISFRFK